MSDKQKKEKLQEFVDWFKKHIKGYERGEGQLFFNRLLQAFGNAGILEVGAALEERVKKRKGTTGFADFVWKPRIIVELKERGTPLHKHYEQAFEYWLTLVPNRPRYMALCNFDEFWIYDLNTQLNDPVHILKTENLANDWGALAFLLPKEEKPIFNNNNVEVTEAAAKIVGSMYFSLSKRKVDPAQAQRFVLQLVVALFAEDVDLIPKYTLHKILGEAVRNPITQKELTSLFEAMATESGSKKPVKYKSIPFFNGGIFNEVDAVELNFKEIDLLYEASKQDWSKVRPSIFGSIFEASMDPKERHGHGIHYTSELDIQKIVNPTIVRPFRERIQKAKTKKDLSLILKDIREFRVLDPACGSGNFLYISFRELRRLEIEVMELVGDKEKSRQTKMTLVSPKNFYGIDKNGFGLELAKVALCIGRKLSADEFNVPDNILPFENLDENFINKDALFSNWPDVDAIIGNPPFLDARRIGDEFGDEYLKALRKKYSNIPGRADYCVYWFRLAHDSIGKNGRVGLVGTNSIRQNYSREGGLDYILKTGGTITEAVSTQVWSGDAVVHVSIVNWIKGTDKKRKKIFTQDGDLKTSDWKIAEVDEINSSLSASTDVTAAMPLKCNLKPKLCFEGQQPGHDGFRIDNPLFQKFLKSDPKNMEIIYPYLNGQELVMGTYKSQCRYVIDFGETDLSEAGAYREPLKYLEETVLPDWKKNAKKEFEKTGKKTGEHQNRLNKWWQLKRPRKEMLRALSEKNRYIVCARVTKRPIFEFLSVKARADSSLVIFAFDDDYSFGIIQSEFHWKWLLSKGSTLKGDFRYTSDTVFDTFPWPQSPELADVTRLSEAARNLRRTRAEIMERNNWSLRELYRSVELPGDHQLKNAQSELNAAAASAYGYSGDDINGFLLTLNLSIANAEKNSKKVQGPGLPMCVIDAQPFISKDSIEPG